MKPFESTDSRKPTPFEAEAMRGRIKELTKNGLGTDLEDGSNSEVDEEEGEDADMFDEDAYFLDEYSNSGEKAGDETTEVHVLKGLKERHKRR